MRSGREQHPARPAGLSWDAPKPGDRGDARHYLLLSGLQLSQPASARPAAAPRDRVRDQPPRADRFALQGHGARGERDAGAGELGVHRSRDAIPLRSVQGIAPARRGRLHHRERRHSPAQPGLQDDARGAAPRRSDPGHAQADWRAPRHSDQRVCNLLRRHPARQLRPFSAPMGGNQRPAPVLPRLRLEDGAARGQQSRRLLESRDGPSVGGGRRNAGPPGAAPNLRPRPAACRRRPAVRLALVGGQRGSAQPPCQGLQAVSQRQPALARRRHPSPGVRPSQAMTNLVRRLLALIPVALGVATLTFALIHLVPGDPVVAMLGETAAPADIARMRHELGLDRPLLAQYASFLRGVAHGDLGESISAHEPVARLIAQRYPATLELTGAGLLVAVMLALPLGLVAGADPGGAADLGAMGFAILGISIPHLYLGPLLMIVFSLDLGWLPLTGRGGLAHLVLPAVTLGTALAAVLARMLRQSLVQVRAADYLRTARAKGLSASSALVRHGLRNALTPVITLLGLQAGGLLTGAIIVEMIFSWPGMGRMMIAAISARDYPLVEGCVLVFALSYVVVNMLTDLVYGLIDPRIRLGA